MPPGSSAGGQALLAKYGREYFVELGKKGAAARAAKARSNLMKELQLAVAEIAEKARQNASWSSDIPGAISVSTVGIQADDFFCSIEVDLTKAPQARAYEYGSGIHASKGVAEKYPIFPKDKAVLAFHWPGHSADIKPSGKYAGVLRGGRMVFFFVEHPGVEAKPYIAPAVRDGIKAMKKSLAKAFKNAFVGESFNATER